MCGLVRAICGNSVFVQALPVSSFVEDAKKGNRVGGWREREGKRGEVKENDGDILIARFTFGFLVLLWCRW